MRYCKYIFFILFVTSCSYFKPKIENDDIAYVINLIQTNPQSWQQIVNDTTLTDLDDFFRKKENIKLVVDFYEHVKISKFEVINIRNRMIQDSNEKLCDIIMGRKGNEFHIMYNFKYFEKTQKWKLVNFYSKSLIIEKFQKE